VAHHIRERVSFSNYSGLDPSVFQTLDDGAPSWTNSKGWREAYTRFWYRKFYTETRTGQMMTLRSDEPKLYDYQPKRPETPDFLSQKVKLLRDIRTALVILAVIGALILIHMWK
jgi:hypothetical protein